MHVNRLFFSCQTHTDVAANEARLRHSCHNNVKKLNKETKKQTQKGQILRVFNGALIVWLSYKTSYVSEHLVGKYLISLGN